MTTHRPSLRLRAGMAFLLTSVLAITSCGVEGISGDGGGDDASESSDWTPQGPLTMVAAFGAGGGTDKVARAMLAGIEQCADGVTGNVEYREGGSGVVGYTYFMQQQGKSDMIMASTTELTTLPLFVDTPFTWENYTPIARIANDTVSLVVPAASPITSLQDLVDEAKTRKVTVGVVGVSGPDNIIRGLLEEQAGIEFESVVFNNGGETTAAILGNDVDAVLGGAGDIVGQVEAGTARALAVFAEERYQDGPMAPVPTAVEQGFDVTFGQWRGLIGPPGMPEEAVTFYADCLEQWTETPAYEEYLETSLALPAFQRGDDFEQYLADQEALIREVLGR
ncbi:tripartite tricarboxylate transporter substrate binding protein [Jiangella asiatica]|uniref:Tripartite tricarboxylate transporter substrate binding protein n=1 Tax=Jiangella asiatica TaxID=2530372 RepID=A0A4R5DF71_9ACTN|nr:tripartite tricarboxylate transporter substrate binding protein [Jiangella asiatica]TDE11817.1 tripartite tricarboxylate transporter substrate binding protein [Jiangella asiatica]